MSRGLKSQSPIENLVYRLNEIMNIVVVWLSVKRIKSFTDDELVKFAKHVIICRSEPDITTLIADLRFHNAGRLMTKLEMEDLAKRWAKGDMIVEGLLLWNMHFNGDRTPCAPELHEGVYFWMVGMNASHQFFAGTDGNGKCYRYSAGESCEVDEYGTPKIDVSDVQEVADWRSYYGHF